MDWYLSLGMKKGNLRFRDHTNDERAHYARLATDIEYNAPWGWNEFMGIHHRGDWDLRRHQEYSGTDMSYHDPQTGETFIPWDIETSAGVDRSLLFLLVDAYSEEDDRIVLKLDKRLAPYKIAVFPLLANKPELVEAARKIYDDLSPRFMVAWDDRGNIGKRYYAQDEIGTPYCVTFDFDSLEDKKVTVRDRDTMKQDRVAIGELASYLEKNLGK
jgi:glycyl-tRNA synthetase